MKKLGNKKKFFLLILLLVGVGTLFLGAPVQAGAEWAGKILGGLIGWIISALGIIMVQVMKALVAVAQYNNFIGAEAINHGWKIVRDVCNMFFVVVLLIIALATILNQEKYSYKTWLPKLILMAVLINFSKMICGLIIDVAQVVMMTFVNAFKDVAAGNLVSNLGILDVVTLANNSSELGFWAIVGAYFLGLIYMIVSLVVIITMLAMLVMRMVMIWVYVVLSPLAYVLASFPGGQKYSSQWWSEFTKNVIVGPVLAFFIWLSFVSLQAFDPAEFNVDSNFGTEEAAESLTMKPSSSQYGTVSNSGATTKAGELDVFLKFIIAIGMLIGGLKVSSEIGGAAGGLAGKGMAKLQKGVALTGKIAKTGAKNLGMAAVNQKGVRNALDYVGSRTGVAGALLRVTGVKGLARSGVITLGKHKMAVEEKAKKKVDALKKAGGSRTISSMADSKAYTMGQKAAKKAAKKIFVVPQTRFNNTSGQVGLSGKDVKEAESWLNEFDFKKDIPSLSQVAQLGKSGINLTNVPKFQEYLEKNADARGAYNSGQIDAGLTGFVTGRDRNGNYLQGAGRHGHLIVGDDLDKALNRKKGDSAYVFREDKLVSQNESGVVDINEAGDYSLRVSDEEKKKTVKTETEEKKVESPEVLQQKKRIKDITGNQDDDLAERTRNKIHEWNTADSQDYFQSENQIKEAYSQASAEKKEEESRIEKEKKEALDKKMAEPGSGSLSVNGFARGQQNYIGVDFSKLSDEIQNKLKAQSVSKDLSNIKGLNVSSPNEAKKISESLIKIIDDEIKSLEEKNSGKKMPETDKMRMDKLNTAKKKLKNPKNTKNLELVNSSAKGYNVASDVKRTILHEDVHGKLGMKNEEATEFVTDHAKSQEINKVRKGGREYKELLEGYIDEKQRITPSRKNPKKILAQEEDDEELKEYNLREGDNSGDVTNITNVTNVINKGADDIKNNFKPNNNLSFLTFYFTSLVKSINKLNSTFSNKINSPSEKFDDKKDALS